jgi:hypothetical protein
MPLRSRGILKETIILRLADMMRHAGSCSEAREGESR